MEESRTSDQLTGVLAQTTQEQGESAQRFEEARQEVLDSIASGESVSLEDGVVAMYGEQVDDHPEILENYQRAQEAIQGRAGEPVLTVELLHKTVNAGCTVHSSVTREETVSWVSLGVLAEDEIGFQLKEEPLEDHELKQAIMGSYFPASPKIVGGGPNQGFDSGIPLHAINNPGFVPASADVTLPVESMPQVVTDQEEAWFASYSPDAQAIDMDVGDRELYIVVGEDEIIDIMTRSMRGDVNPKYRTLCEMTASMGIEPIGVDNPTLAEWREACRAELSEQLDKLDSKEEEAHRGLRAKSEELEEEFEGKREEVWAKAEKLGLELEQTSEDAKDETS